MVAVEIALARQLLAIASNFRPLFFSATLETAGCKVQTQMPGTSDPVFVQPRVHGAAAKGFWLLANKMRATWFEI